MSAIAPTNALSALPQATPAGSASVVATMPKAASPTDNQPVPQANHTMRGRIAQLLNTMTLPHQPARLFSADWPKAADAICREWVDAQARHNVTTVSTVALSRMKALEFERKNRHTIPEDDRLLPATATKRDYYQAEIEAFLAAVGEPDPQAVLESFKLVGTGGLHRQHTTIGAAIGNAISVATVLTPDPVSKVALVSARLLTQIGTTATVVAAGPRRLRNACAEDVMPLGRADSAPAAKRAPNMLQASLSVMRTLKIKDINKSLEQMEVAMQALARERNGGNVKARQDARQQLELAFARICHQLSVKAAYKTASESAKIELANGLRYLLTSYTGTVAMLTATMVGILAPVFISTVVSGGLLGAATALTVVMYLGYQLSKGPSRDGEGGAKRAIVALIKLLEVLEGENTHSTRQRGAAYADYLQDRKVPRFTRPAERKKIREVALAKLQDRLAGIAQEKMPAPGLDLATNWAIYSRHIKNAAKAEQEKPTGPECRPQSIDHDKSFREAHLQHFAVEELVAAWKTPMRIRIDAASRLLRGKVAQSAKRLLALKSSETAGTSRGRAGRKERQEAVIEQQKQELCDRLRDLFNLELALQDLTLAAGASKDSINLTRATERLTAINDVTVRNLFCGDAEEQVDAVRQSKQLIAGANERYNYVNFGGAALGVTLNLGISGADLVVNVGQATHAYPTLETKSYKAVAISQATQQPNYHQNLGTHAGFFEREIKPTLKRFGLKDPAPEHHMELTQTGNVLQPDDDAVEAALHKLTEDLWNADVVLGALRLTLRHASPALAESSKRATLPAPPETEELVIDLEPTTAFHRVQYKKNRFAQRVRHAGHHVAMIARQSAISIAGLPVQAFAQHRVRKAAAALATATGLGREAQILLQPTEFDPQEVPVNESGVRCLENRHVVMVQAGTPDQAPRPIHAHKIAQQLRSNAAYAAGQSPQQDSVDNIILQGLESGQGIFQFVSRMAHYDPENSREKPVIALLLKNLKQNPEQKIGGRYRVISFKPIGGGNSDFLRHQLVAMDTWSKPEKKVQMPITQAGLQFTDRVLSAPLIARASALLDDHNTWVTQPAEPINAEKMILSFAGIGRNATLITYRVLREAIKDGKVTAGSLDDALDAEIMANRVRRGPRYVHSQDQRDALRAALLEVIKDQAKKRAPASQV
ncbi:hypothetical protein [Actimicrobium sp. CCI2.3]|uniref:hypothetical protein n=2 Tax=Actimicrobium sp. CCI2.3 TaxID=3048616 RepID=UPI002B250CA4|nr:hypothetical protein [Actimicrobium sp. CCI2.3]MEB0020567.1 hypothetical protein [Actimicrobium sp. CCI2.3]